MKKLLIIGAVALFGAMNAQVKFGVVTGMATGMANGKAPGIPNTSSSATGFYAGAFLELKAAMFAVQPGVNYVNIDGGSAIQIPIIAKYYFIPKFNLQFGPQFLFETGEIPAAYKNVYNKTNLGIALGAGVDIVAGITAEARYSIQLNNHVKNAPSGTSLKANYLNIGLGYKF